MFIPLSYNLRSLFQRRSSTLLTIFGVGATVAVFAGVFSLQQGFSTLFAENGRSDVALFLRPGSTYEGDSIFSRGRALTLIKSVPEIAQDAGGQPLAGMECFLAVRRFKLSGGETNVPIRGVQPATFAIRGDDLKIIEGRNFEPGRDEVIVGSKLVDRIEHCSLGDVIELNTTPMKVVGIFEEAGPYASEIWGDLERMLAALQRFGPNRVIAQLRPEADVEGLALRLEDDKDVPAKVQTEIEYFSAQTAVLSFVLGALGVMLGVIMGIAAVFTATNTMLAAISARTHEIGILLASGFRPLPIFLSFQFEALVLCLLGGVVGCLFTLPLNGIKTGTTNFQTFTEVAFAFRVTPAVLVNALIFSLVLGLLGGAWPAWRASRLTPTKALRRH